MDYRYGGQIRKAIHDFVQNPQANLIVSFTILAAAMYVSLAAIVGRQLLHPYEHMKLSANSTMDEMISSSFSIFFFWISSVVVGYLATLAKLPSLFGSLLVGFFITNIPALSNVVYLNDYWHYIIRKLCLVCIIIRWGLGINGTYIRENPAYPLALGVLSAIAEAAVIAIVSVIFFNIPIEFGVIGGFMLATVSPAVCGPVMIKLQKQDLGTDKNIPCFVPAACCFDNTFSIITVTLMSAVTFTNESKFGNLVRNVGEMILCGIIGIFIGRFLWYFPLPNRKSTHTIRILLIIFLSIGIITGMTAINHGFPGVVACLILCFVAPSRWRTDNPKKLVPVANFFAKLWNYVASPLLFSLVGTFLDFNRVSLHSVLEAIILVIAGTLARLASGFAIVVCSPLSYGEQFIVVWSLVPKATVQAALGPNLFVLAEEFPQFKKEAAFVVTSCIVAVLITAPIGAFVLDFTAPLLVKKSHSVRS
ncbi:hypothetical protein Q1695_000165 [Nippostrongylus brasiliensis]|nr:hypothetical protein Q1695_000165 [Nippostrongylus brasiliensis]